MRSKTAKQILDETPKEVKDKVQDYANRLILYNVSGSTCKEQLLLHSVVVPKGTLKTFEDLPEETKEYRKSGDAIIWKNK